MKTHTLGIAGILLTLLTLLAGCSAPPIQLGDKDTERQLKQLQPVAGRAAIYVCRNAHERLTRTTVILDDKPVAGLLPNTFAHALVEPGPHVIRLDIKRPGLMHSLYGGGNLSFDVKAGELKFFWVGITGGGFGVLTIDHFDTEAEARACMQAAQYAVLLPSP